MLISVVITTYNRPDALSAVLAGYLAQSDRDFEIVVADDGSTPDTAQTIREFKARAPFPVLHVWQEDLGFRLSASRNRALAQCRAPYVIFTDGDCIPHREFVARHRALSEKGCFLAGNRILFSQEFTREVLEKKIEVADWSFLEWLQAKREGKINRLLPLIALPDLLRKSRKWQGAIGCNLSAWHDDLIAVNGFDEAYTGWGLEDSDLVIRLLRHGVKRKSAKFAAPVFHLWHREYDRSHLPENSERLRAILSSRETRAKLGLDQYPSAT